MQEAGRNETELCRQCLPETPEWRWRRMLKVTQLHSTSQLQRVPALFDPQVRVDARIAGSAGEVLVLAVGNVDVRLRIPVLFGQTEVNDMHLVSLLSQPCERQ
eukprot:scaffold143824_cov21-Tisochrysis_lutea.AAC.1